MSSVDTLDAVPAPAKPPTGFFDLPLEVQKEIFSHCSQGDLICSSLVSRAFRELAAAQLYRNFHIVFPDEDDPSYDSPIDGLAGGLDTFVTSDYDYAQHLRDIMLDTLSAGNKAETAYKPYLYSASCGKFLNTLLLVTLKKAKSLEAFRWNIRVELSRPVYQALHRIDTLKTLHLRLQAGPSLYEAPPPLPFSGASSSISAVLSSITHEPSPPPPPPPVFTQSTFSISTGNQVFYVAPTSVPPPPPVAPPKHMARNKPYRKSSLSRESPTLSGLKNLKNLSVLDIDSLEVITELKSCIQNSARSLTKLQLSFSEYLGSQARKPPPDLEPEDSDPDDDEFQVAPPPPVSGFNDDVSGPARAFRAQEERRSQEAVLGRIFDVEPYLLKKPKVKQPKEKGKETKGEPRATSGQNFINSLTELSRKLMKEVNQSDDLPTPHQDLLDLIEKAARKYVDSEETGGPRPQPEKSGEGSSSATEESKLEDEGQEAAEKSSDSGLFETTTHKTKDTQKEASPDDIDIEEPLEQLSLEPQDSTISETSPNEATNPPGAVLAGPSSSCTPAVQTRVSETTRFEKAASNLEAHQSNADRLSEKAKNFDTQANELIKEIEELNTTSDPSGLARLVEAQSQMEGLSKNIQDNIREMRIAKAEIDDTKKQVDSWQTVETAEAAQQRRMAEYLRSTRGLALETLSIYLIPVKASVLHKAMDIRSLRRLTLLNVGPQGPIWTLFHKENKESPLPLRKIFTDNVSMAFLNFVHTLDEVHDLFMLERDSKTYKPESFAPKTNATIAHIRRLVLKKHMPTLRRLMIKNQSDISWDFDEKTFSVVCGRGRVLEELACSTRVKAMHIFMRKMAKLVNLRALHIVSLRNDDTCVWVMRETKEFLLDNLSHHPNMKLEWVSIDEDDRVDRILLPSEMPAKPKKKGKKGKQKATNFSINGGTSSFPVFPPLDSWDVNSDSDDDDEEEMKATVDRMRGLKFYDVWDVNIFKKEVVYGRL